MSSRYYEEIDDDIRPGKISADLKAALNLAENDVPIWIYRMRALGYPPGWLSKAIVDTSDIFETDAEPTAGKRKGAPEEPQYDHSKLIEYPGFNAPLPPNTHDYHYYFNMPPMLPHQQLEYAKKTMSSYKPEPPTPPQKRSRSSAGSADKQAKVKEDSNKSGNHDESSSGDSDEEDEEDESPESPTKEEGVSNGDNDKTNLSSTTKDKSKTAAANQSITSLNSTLSEGIKLVSRGSPMPKPVDRLPLERFSEGVVGELLYFENTPNSTGKFDTIRGLLNTMRQSRSENEEDST